MTHFDQQLILVCFEEPQQLPALGYLAPEYKQYFFELELTCRSSLVSCFCHLAYPLCSDVSGEL